MTHHDLAGTALRALVTALRQHTASRRTIAQAFFGQATLLSGDKWPMFGYDCHQDVVFPPTKWNPEAIGHFVLKPPRACARRFHRMFVHCPMCDRQIPYGRLHQHAKVHEVSNG